MKSFNYLLLSAFLTLGLNACNKANKTSELALIHEDIASIQTQAEETRIESRETGLKAAIPISRYSREFLNRFCEIIDKKTPKEDVLSLLSEEGNAYKTYSQVVQISNAVTDCQMLEAKFYDHPFDLAEYKTDKGYVYIQVTYDKNLKVKSFIPFVFNDQVEIKMSKVLTRDNVELTTYVVHKKNLTEKVGSVFLRTPYMVYGGYISYAQLALHYNKALVLQANRGSHTSEGEFKWLEKGNIQDSYDSIDWISKQDFSNGKVMAYGVSYDGFDALASAASNHPALKSVIACSAPANAATDSFTSSRFVENGIFTYVTTDRKVESMDKIDTIWDFIQTEIPKKSRVKMDDILLGLDYEEWNITNEAIDDINHPYWSERQILDELMLAKMPIAHIAGLKQDQDGRDTLLAFQEIQKKSLYKDQNYLILHQEGHGCGDAYDLDIYSDLIGLTDTDSTAIDLSKNKKLSRYNVKTGGFSLSDNEAGLPLSEKLLSLPDSVDVGDFGFMSNPDPNLFEKNIELKITEDITLNGAPKMKLYYKASAPEIPLHVYFRFIDPRGYSIANTTGWRTGFVSQKLSTVESVDLTFPLVNAKVPAGSILQIHFTTRDKRIFYRQPLIRDQFLNPAGLFQPSIEILNQDEFKSTIVLPIEFNNIISTNLPSLF